MASRRAPGSYRFACAAVDKPPRVVGRVCVDRDRWIALLWSLLALQTRNQNLSDADQNVDGRNSAFRFTVVGVAVS